MYVCMSFNKFISRTVFQISVEFLNKSYFVSPCYISTKITFVVLATYVLFLYNSIRLNILEKNKLCKLR
jgi:hypothetical protein